VHSYDPNSQVVTVNGSSYSIKPTDNVFNSTGQLVSSTNTNTGVVCTSSVVGTVPGKTLQVGQSWSNTVSTTCSDAPTAPTSVARVGSVLALESVTVPAGTFSALKVLHTEVSQNGAGVTLTETITNWVDTLSGVVVKATDTLAYSAAPSVNGYAVSRTTVLTPTYTRAALVASTTPASWARDIVDNSTPAVSVHLTYNDYINVVSLSGNYTLSELDTTGAPVVVGASTYQVDSLDIRLNADHQILSTVGRDNANSNNCTYNLHGSGVVYPISVGVKWTNTFTKTCLDGTVINSTQTGTVTGVESVTVPAGTFTAAKLESTIVNTNTISGLITTTSATVWANVQGGNVVKRVFTHVYSGTVPSRSLPVRTVETLQ